MDCSPPVFSVYGILQTRILEWVAIPLLQGIFPTHGSNPGLLHGRLILYHLSHHKMTGWIQRPITLLPLDSGYNISWPTRMVAVSDLQVSAPGAHSSVLLLHRLCNVETVM